MVVSFQFCNDEVDTLVHHFKFQITVHTMYAFQTVSLQVNFASISCF